MKLFLFKVAQSSNLEKSESLTMEDREEQRNEIPNEEMGKNNR
jgi:hypothetical protein